MTLYTFYPSGPDGTSDTFISLELHDDAEACLLALKVLDDHDCTEVAVWAGERRITTRRRIHPDLRALLGVPRQA